MYAYIRYKVLQLLLYGQSIFLFWPHLKFSEVSSFLLVAYSTLTHVTFGWLHFTFSTPSVTRAHCEVLPSSFQSQSSTRQPSKEQKPDHAMLFFLFSLLSMPAVQSLWGNAVICSTGFDMWQPLQAAYKQAQFPHRPVCPCWSMPEQVSYLSLMGEISGCNYIPAKDLKFTSSMKTRC